VSGRDRPGGSFDADTRVVDELHPRDRDALMDVDAPTGGGLREPPHDRVVPGERAGRVVRGAHHRQLAAAAQVHQRTHLEDLVRSEDVGLHAECPVQGGLLPLDLEGVLGVTEIELTLGAELDVVSELLRQPSEAGEAGGVQRDRLRRVVVRAEDLRVPPAPAAADVGTLEHGDIPDAMFGGEVIRERQPVHPASDDHDVVGRSQLALRQIRPATEETRHVRGPLPSCPAR
jgi:hypothetical protein